MIKALTIAFLLSAPLQAASCLDDDFTRKFCATVDLAITCLDGRSDCDSSSYFASTVSKSLLYVGIAVGSAEALAAQRRLQGMLEHKAQALETALNMSWTATSYDGNWIKAVNAANDGLGIARDRLQQALRAN